MTAPRPPLALPLLVRLRGDLDMLSSSQIHALCEQAALEIEELHKMLHDYERVYGFDDRT